MIAISEKSWIPWRATCWQATWVFVDALPTNDSYKSNMARLNAVEDYKEGAGRSNQSTGNTQQALPISPVTSYIRSFSTTWATCPNHPTNSPGGSNTTGYRSKKVAIDGKTHNGITVGGKTPINLTLTYSTLTTSSLKAKGREMKLTLPSNLRSNIFYLRSNNGELNK